MWKVLKELFDIGHEINHNKQWYYSKTLWINVSVLIALLVDKYTGGVTDQQSMRLFQMY